VCALRVYVCAACVCLYVCANCPSHLCADIPGSRSMEQEVIAPKWLHVDVLANEVKLLNMCMCVCVRVCLCMRVYVRANVGE
jgi:hypothetical protein